MSKILLFIDTESTIVDGERIIYDFSFTVVKQCKKYTDVKFTKSLRSRDIISKNYSKILYESNTLIDEFADMVPVSKQALYGFADYYYMTFDETIKNFKNVCTFYKPDAIIGYNMHADFEAIKNTQYVLKSNKDVYSKNDKLSSNTLFKKNVCPAFDNSYKTDLMLYLTNHCNSFMKEQETFAKTHKLLTKNGYISRKLLDMYRYSTNNENIEQLHIGYYDNMYCMKCIEKSIETDGMQYFPVECMSQNDRKRKHIDDDDENHKKIKFQSADIPKWFDDQFQNSKCIKNETILDVRKYHPDFGGTNSKFAPYFKGENSGAGIWPPNNYYNVN